MKTRLEVDTNAHDRGPPLGRLLKHWRQVRGQSQLDLAVDAGVSARHVSFIESGRSNPSREMLLLLANTLDIPLRERNQLFEAAGYAALYREAGLSSPELELARQACDLILSHQEPYPAVVMDRYWNILQANEAANRFFRFLLDGKVGDGDANVVRLMFDPSAVRPWVANWEEVAASLLVRIRHESIGGIIDERSQELMNEVLDYPDVRQRLKQLPAKPPLSPLVPIRFRKHDLAVDFFSTVTTLGTPQDITLQELRVECFFPASPETIANVKRFARKERGKAAARQ